MEAILMSTKFSLSVINQTLSIGIKVQDSHKNNVVDLSYEKLLQPYVTKFKHTIPTMIRSMQKKKSRFAITLTTIYAVYEEALSTPLTRELQKSMSSTANFALTLICGLMAYTE
ncbi:hypothetical protein AVEN_271457-1 [Araneus ventricosus]|uniref:Uncharacterized protein n=1 Tax=Araneus ventricosus TaxID=182803 RepID=A0A4Y2T3H1_ARAVE|nr:hypothetical protein AVEN_271457-1 [Araneus ventricosus]